MSIFKTAYDTTACKDFVMKKTIDALQVALPYGAVMFYSDHISLVQGGGSEVSAIPAFAHPLYLPSEQRLVADVRPFGKWDEHQHQFNIRNMTEHQLLIRRTELNELWIRSSPALLRDISQTPIATYASWISEAVARRFALDPAEQYRLCILAAYFYLGLFTDDCERSERESLRMVNAITKATRAKAEDVFEILESLPILGTISGFCEAAGDVVGSVRLKELNPGLLIAIMGGTWFSTNAKELVAVALEHPPTWLAILLAAFDERSFKNSAITKIIERGNGKANGKDYIRAVLNLIASARA